MKLVDGGTYKTENGYLVTVRRNSLPFYKFSAKKALDPDNKECEMFEVWTEEGVAYHNDCGFNFLGWHHGRLWGDEDIQAFFSPADTSDGSLIDVRDAQTDLFSTHKSTKHKFVYSVGILSNHYVFVVSSSPLTFQELNEFVSKQSGPFWG